MTPDEFTIKESFLDVGDGHQLYIQDWGNPAAKTPILFLHGGPGGGCKDKYKQTFDPSVQRVIFHDQRGSGRSLPYGSLEHNTTQDLIEDIEKLAKYLRLERFVVTGGSWGSSLALYYAIQYPERVTAMVLYGVLTLAQNEIDWLDKGRFQTFFPDAWENYLSATPKTHHSDPASYHFKRILGADPETAKASAYAYSNLEGSIAFLDDRFTPQAYDEFDPAAITIEVHYMAHQCFLPDRYVFDHAQKLTMPIWLVQGRYDFVAPPMVAYELHRELPDSQLLWTVSGHASSREAWNVKRTIFLQLAGDQ